MIEHVIEWLRVGGQEKSASILSDCEINLLFVDVFFEIFGEQEWVVYDVNIAAPYKILSEIEDLYIQEKRQIEQAIREVAQAENLYIRDITWIPKLSTEKSPVANEISEQLLAINSEHVQRTWKKALRRKKEDPEGAITAARTLLETVCKHILDEERISYPDNADLPKLYHLVAQHLSLAPDQYTEHIVRTILGNCQSVVGSIAALRNKIGDAHGKSTKVPIPQPILADLAVNLAGAMASYLLGVWESSKQKG